jgi:hypothetical protein
VGVPVELQEGRHGQFDVLVNDRLIVSRKGGLMAKLTGKPWPEDDDVVRAVRGALAS